MFEYIEENLQEIKNPDNVIMIKTIKGSISGYLGAYLKDGEFIRLTKSKNFMTYPFEPLYWLTRIVGKFYWENFDQIFDNIAINKIYLQRFIYAENPENKKRYDLYAEFVNGVVLKLAHPEIKYFNKKLLPELQTKFGVEIEKRESGITIE